MKGFQVFALSVSFILAGRTLAAPADVPNPVLQQNALDAQTLNSQFENLEADDQCNPGTIACIGNTIAFCASNSQFVASQNCQRSQNCFALPSVTGPGTTVACTTEADALSIFAACGADGTDLEQQQAADNSNNNNDNNNDDNGNDNDGDDTVTVAQVVTVSVQSNGQPTTIGAVTQTISPDDVASLLSSLTATSTSTSTTSTSTTTSTSSSSSTTDTSTSTSTSTDAAQTLTVTSTSSSSSSTDTTSSSSSTDTPAATPAGAVSGGDGGGAIGGITTTSVTFAQPPPTST